MSTALLNHLAGGASTTCRCWKLTRGDGVVMGFTDHDRALQFDGVSFLPETGLSATAIAQSTGLSIDNSEALGALRSDAIDQGDLVAGRYDGAEVVAWLVNWQDVSARMVQFRGHIGEVSRASGAFVAELRGLSEALNQPQGRAYQRQCTAVLGDAACGVDLSAPGRAADVVLDAVEDARVLRFADPQGVAAGALVRGRVVVLEGAAAGLTGQIKTDSSDGATRTVALWQRLEGGLAPGDVLRVEMGCDKTPTTCKERFANFANFRGFPHIPGEDWLISYPVQGGANDGGSLFGEAT